MKRTASVAVAALALAAALLAGLPAPVGAAESPALTSSAMAGETGDPVTLTLTGCEGGQTHIEILSPWHEGDPTFPSLLTPTEGPAGVWTAETTLSSSSDIVYQGICASGARSPKVQVDLEWKEMFPDPFFEQDVPLRSITGTDCDTGEELIVWVRAGERMVVLHPTPGVRGDWSEPPPPVIPEPYAILVAGQCGTGSPNYIGFGYRSGPGAVLPTRSTGWRMSAGDGPPGTAYTAQFTCDASDLSVTRTQVGSDDAVDVPVGLVGGRKGFSAVAGQTDDRYTLRCGPKIVDTIRFDVEAPGLALAPADDAGPARLTGTDCPPSTEAAVVFESEAGERSTATAAIDAFGDWVVDLPGDLAGRVDVTASCGGLTYDALVYDAAAVPGAPVSPGAAPGTGAAAAPASAVAGSPTYTG